MQGGELDTALWPRGLVLHSAVMFCKCLLVPMDIIWVCVEPPPLIPFSPVCSDSLCAPKSASNISGCMRTVIRPSLLLSQVIAAAYLY